MPLANGKLPMDILLETASNNEWEMDVAWVRSIRDQAKATGCAFFYKQKLAGGKKVSLPMLDGRQWAEMPEASNA